MDFQTPQPETGNQNMQSSMPPQTPEPQQPQPIPVATANGTESIEYVSNPFLVGLRTIIAGLRNNPVAVMLTPLVVIGAFLVAAFIAIIFAVAGSTAGNVLAILLMIVMYLLVLPVILGMYYTIAVHSSRDEKVSTKEAFDNSLKRVLPMLGLIILCAMGTILGLILLIVPGIIFFVRASLAPAAMYFEDLGVLAAIKRSFSLTKGHFVETLGAILAGGFFGSDGLIAPYFGIGQMVGRYHDYKMLQDTGSAKPKVHWLNYVPVIIIVVIVVLYGVALGFTFNNAKSQAEKNRLDTQQRLDDLRNNTYRYDSDFDFDY